MDLLGSVEAGGTKFVCAVGTAGGELTDRITIPTTSPDETLERVLDHLERHRSRLRAIGVASFGPIDLRRGSADYGHITSTPKPGWQGCDIVGLVARRWPGLPLGFDTDTNAAALAESHWGAGRGLETFMYVTVGTGIGGGGLVEGSLMHGLLHPEIGHMRIPRDPRDDFEGDCPYHGDCWEGLASGTAIARRWGKPAAELCGDELAIEAHYLASGVANLVVTLSPQRIILGGGVMTHPDLLAAVRAETVTLLNGYVQTEQITRRIDDYLVAPGLGRDAGVLGGIALAARAALAAADGG